MEKKLKHKPLPFINEFVDGTVTMSGKEFTETDFDQFFESINRTIKDEKIPTSNSSISSSGTGKWNNSTIIDGSWTGEFTTGGPWAGSHTYPSYPSTHTVPNTWIDSVTSTTTESTSITIHDENGSLKKLSIAEVSRYYAEALEYRKIKRFAKLFPMVKELLNELLVAMKLSDPLDDDELNRLEEELKESKKKK